jgi:hypothetical protein
MGRHHADTDASRVLRDWYDSLPVPAMPARHAVPSCPRCGAARPIDYGSRIGCGECGHLWQAGADEPPLSPRERYDARRRLDERAEP